MRHRRHHKRNKPSQSPAAKAATPINNAMSAKKAANSLCDEMNFKVTREGFIINAMQIQLKDWLPEWATIENLHHKVDPVFYKKVFAAVATFMNVQVASAHHYGPEGMLDCFQEPNGDGIGVIHTNDLSGVPDEFPGNITNALFQLGACGEYILTNCTDAIMSNVTTIYNFIYPAPSLVKSCIDYAMQTVGYFSISDTFNNSGILCIINKGQEILKSISDEAKNALLNGDNSNPTSPASGNGATIGISIAVVLGLVACTGGYLCYFKSKHGHLPFADTKITLPSIFKGSNYQNSRNRGQPSDGYDLGPGKSHKNTGYISL